MADLKDYSGPFRPDLKLEDFSKEALARAWVETSKLYMLMDAYWRNVLTEKFPQINVWDLDFEIWDRLYPGPHFARMTKALNIKGNDVATLFKFFQTDPVLGVIFPVRFELKDNNHGIMTNLRCTSIEWLEKHKNPETEKIAAFACELDRVSFIKVASMVNPKMKTICLKKSPRQSPDDPYCQWEFKVEP